MCPTQQLPHLSLSIVKASFHLYSILSSLHWASLPSQKTDFPCVPKKYFQPICSKLTKHSRSSILTKIHSKSKLFLKKEVKTCPCSCEILKFS